LKTDSKEKRASEAEVCTVTHTLLSLCMDVHTYAGSLLGTYCCITQEQPLRQVGSHCCLSIERCLILLLCIYIEATYI
jgi:hypothetical protein